LKREVKMVTKTAIPMREAKAEAPVRTARCQHYWMIEPPDSRTSKAECLLCGDQRRFPNYLSDCLIENDREQFEEWLAKHGRRKPKGKGDLDILSEV
jgi:hypothetical protein